MTGPGSYAAPVRFQSSARSGEPRGHAGPTVEVKDGSRLPCPPPSSLFRPTSTARAPPSGPRLRVSSPVLFRDGSEARSFEAVTTLGEDRMGAKDGGSENRRERPVRVRTGDGVHIGGTLFRAGGERGFRTAVVLAPALGVRQDFYRPFARYLSERGLTVLTFDYRGTGASRPSGSLRELDDDLLDWALRDVREVLRWVRGEIEPERTGWVGHSMGVPLLGLSGAGKELDAVLAVAAPHAHWRLWSGRDRLRMWAYWHLLFPLTTNVVGYFPGRALGLGADLPPAVALQWARWARHPDYLVDDAGQPLRAGFEKVTCPVRAYSSDQDRLAPPVAVEALMQFFTRAEIRHTVLRDREVGERAYGHLDFFREEASQTLWPEMASWLDETLADTLT